MAGAQYMGNGRCWFEVWAPFRHDVSVKVVSRPGDCLTMKKGDKGYWSVMGEDVKPGDRYLYLLDGKVERPDPVSYFQPDGVHGPSAVIDHDDFVWGDSGWTGIPLEDYIIYELHTGTFTSEGTFGAVVPYLDYLADLGITAIEIMPVAQFPGSRNWGYDGVYPFAPQNSYGGPDGLKSLVDACHRKGIAVILDVVYNHLGPEGNYLAEFGPYFTNRYKTPWGDAVNLDGPYSDEVREYFINNALYWISTYHFDALRLDAIHGIFDFGATSFLRELVDAVHGLRDRLGRKVYVIAESDLNDVRVIDQYEAGGFGFDAQWNDDYHHALHTLLTGEDRGYYEDFGRLEHLAKALREGFIYSGQYSVFRKRRHGSSSAGRQAAKFVVFSQNHDQVGNRAAGDRLTATLSPEQLKLAACAVIFAPNIPLLFMGEEYGETAPFAYFVSHSDKDLIEAVRKGRKEEFASFGWASEVPDPQDEGTFRRCRLDHELRLREQHKMLFDIYRTLIKMRKSIPALSVGLADTTEVTFDEAEKVLLLKRSKADDSIILIFNLSESVRRTALFLPDGLWHKVFDSSSAEGLVNGTQEKVVGGEVIMTINAWSCMLYRRAVKE